MSTKDEDVLKLLVNEKKVPAQSVQNFSRYLEASHLTLSQLATIPDNLLANVLSQPLLQLNITSQVHLAIAIKQNNQQNQFSEIKASLDEILDSLEISKKTKGRKDKKPVKTPRKDDTFAKKSTKKEDFVIQKKAMGDVFEKITKIGSGGFSEVWKSVNKETNEVVAVKMVQKSKLKEGEINREIMLMQKLKHPNIVQLKDVFEDKDIIHLVLEYVEGGELFEQIVNRGSYTEEDAASVIRQILDAVSYMHKNGIAHRDLKPENLLVGGSNNSVIKLIDFGLSKEFQGDSALQTVVGTVDYVAPEVLSETSAYTNAVDIWSIGVITFILLCGYPPFYGDTDQAVFLNILSGKYKFGSPDWDNVSNDAKDFIRGILVLNPDQRPTADELMSHTWIKNKAPSNPLRTLDSFKQTMTKRKAKTKKF